MYWIFLLLCKTPVMSALRKHFKKIHRICHCGVPWCSLIKEKNGAGAHLFTTTLRDGSSVSHLTELTPKNEYMCCNVNIIMLCFHTVDLSVCTQWWTTEFCLEFRCISHLACTKQQQSLQNKNILKKWMFLLSRCTKGWHREVFSSRGGFVCVIRLYFHC